MILIKTQFGNNPVEVNNALQNLNSIILTAANKLSQEDQEKDQQTRKL